MPGNNQNIQSVNDILKSIDILADATNQLSQDFGDANYDKSLDIKMLFSQIIDDISKTTFNNNEERQAVRTALISKVKPAIERLKQFYINRKNYLSAEYDVLAMTEQMNQGLTQAVQAVDQASVQQSANSYAMPPQEQQAPVEDMNTEVNMSQEDKGRARVLYNPNMKPGSFNQAA